MNERIKEIGEKAGLFMEKQHPGGFPNEELSVAYNFAELIVQECMRMCDVAAVGYETHGHMKEANGCDSAKEYIAEHFGLKERTASQKMADAGYTRRPKGWTKEGEE